MTRFVSVLIGANVLLLAVAALLVGIGTAEAQQGPAWHLTSDSGIEGFHADISRRSSAFPEFQRYDPCPMLHFTQIVATGSTPGSEMALEWYVPADRIAYVRASATPGRVEVRSIDGGFTAIVEGSADIIGGAVAKAQHRQLQRVACEMR